MHSKSALVEPNPKLTTTEKKERRRLTDGGSSTSYTARETGSRQYTDALNYWRTRGRRVQGRWAICMPSTLGVWATVGKHCGVHLRRPSSRSDRSRSQS
eukprot:143456-Prymnesium_polylepis.2